MPIASRLIAAFCLMVVAFLLSRRNIVNAEDGKDYRYFTDVNKTLGIICGWMAMGKRAGRG